MIKSIIIIFFLFGQKSLYMMNDEGRIFYPQFFNHSFSSLPLSKAQFSVTFINYSLSAVRDAQNVPILHSVRLYILIRARLL